MRIITQESWQAMISDQLLFNFAEEIESGFLIIWDKEQGITSHTVVARVRGTLKKMGFGRVRVGHAGTLDPLATGVLLVLVGRAATKQQAEFMHQEKEYRVVGRLGLVSDTYDSEGEITGSAIEGDVHEWEKNIELRLSQFRGVIAQRVPAYSAVKREGKKLYDMARSGDIDQSLLPVRQVEIRTLELVRVFADEGLCFELRVVCGSGTYIRSLVHDLGETLGVGAMVVALRRVRSGEFVL